MGWKGIRGAILGTLVVAGNVARASSAPGTIFTLAGAGLYAGDNGLATLSSLNSPNSVFVSASGDIYIADSGNNVIRRISGGVISTVAGNGAAGYAGDGGNALDAELNAPKGVCVDASGNIYIADSGNYLVRKVATNGTINTIGGLIGVWYNSASDRSGMHPAVGTALIGADTVAVDGSGNIFVDGTDVIQGSQLNVLPSIELDGGPLSALGADGNLYLSWNDQIHRVTSPLTAPSSTAIAGLAGSYGYSGDGGSALSAKISVKGLTADATGTVYFTESYLDTSVSPWTLAEVVRKVSGGTIQTIAGRTIGAGIPPYPYVFSGEGGAASACYLSGVLGVAIAGTTVYLSDNNCIRAFPVGGNISTLAGKRFSGDNGPAAKAGLNSPAGVAVAPSGDVYIADAANYRIRKVNALGTISSYAGDGNKGYAGDGLGPAATEFTNLSGLAFNGQGDLFVADGARIRKITTAGMVTTVAGTGTYGHSGDGGQGTLAQIQPSLGSMAVDAGGNLYFAEGAFVRKLSVLGVITTVAGNGSSGFGGDGGPAAAAQLGNAVGVAVAGNGDIYIADQSNYRVRMVNHATSTIITVAGGGNYGNAGDDQLATQPAVKLGDVWAVALDQRGNLYIGTIVMQGAYIRVVGTDGIIRAFAGNGLQGELGDGGPATQAEFMGMQALVVDPAGDLLIDDSAADRIREVVANSQTVNLPADAAIDFHVYHAIYRHGDPTSVQVVGNFPAAGSASITVFSPVGRTVKTLFDQVVNVKQQVARSWDGTDDHGEPVASGTYAIRFLWNGGATVKRVLVVR